MLANERIIASTRKEHTVVARGFGSNNTRSMARSYRNVLRKR